MKSLLGVVLLLLCLPRLTNGQTITAQFINGIPQADQFSGADACAKLEAAITYSTTARPQVHLIDATHFAPVVTCSSNPFADLPPVMSNMAILFGSTIWKTSVPWVISTSGLTLKGMGAANSQIEYTGNVPATEVVEFTNSQFDLMDGFFIFGG